jgi:hypothetical protein
MRSLLLPDREREPGLFWTDRVLVAQMTVVLVGPPLAWELDGAVAMNLDSGDTPLVLLCPAWRRWGTARTVKKNTTVLHSRADDVVPFADSEELIRTSGLPASALIEVGSDHRLADPEPLAAMLKACERAAAARG